MTEDLAMKLKCPICGVAIYIDKWEETTIYISSDGLGEQIFVSYCLSCDSPLIRARHGEVKGGGKYDYDSDAWIDEDFFLSNIFFDGIIYPPPKQADIPNEVPERYRKEFFEAFDILATSPKASAAISRRLLQDLLHNELNINHGNLNKEIEEFIEQENTPGYLAEEIDAVRVIGNFAAHPVKYKDTGSIVDVEVGEAEWLLDVLQSLFDHIFVKPIRFEKRRDKINQKLRRAGKPELKSRLKSGS
ncbi:DUF4145 domain-containing protein [Oceanithermus desulfurans]|nr:DUF4145 domain-containing protein [Oceanithermus desulfurans]MBB6029053.1 hypothetical protein [Oceanithermus desulfurans]